MAESDYMGQKRWHIWNFDATRCGVSGPETLPPDGAPQPGLKATEDAPVEVMPVAEHEAVLEFAAKEIDRVRGDERARVEGEVASEGMARLICQEVAGLSPENREDVDDVLRALRAAITSEADRREGR